LFKALGWMTIEERVKYRKATMVYKSLHDHAPSYMSDMYKRANNGRTRENLRSSKDSTKLAVPAHKLQCYSDSFKVSSVQIWNCIPGTVRDSKSLGCFKRSYLKWCDQTST
jgi:hypothetical protein